MRKPSRCAAAWCLLGVSLPLAGWVFFEAQRMFRADWASAVARQQAQLWVSGKAPTPSQEEVRLALAAVQSSLAITPDDPVLHERLGDIQFAAGKRVGLDEHLRRQQFKAAADHYETATALRPREPGAWAMLALSRQLAGDQRSRVQAAWLRAQSLGPFEGHVQPLLMDVVLGDWSGATPAMQEWAKVLFDTGNDGVRNAINAMARPFGLVFAPDLPASASPP